MKRFWTEQALEENSTVTLDSDEGRHAIKALRLKIGDEILVTNGKGSEAKGLIHSIDKHEILVRIQTVRKIEPRPVQLEIIQGVLKGPRMDWLIEKLTELGVNSIHPVSTEFSVADISKEERWKRIAQSAVKQSGNVTIPEIFSFSTLEEKTAALEPTSLKVILSLSTTQSLQHVINQWQKQTKAEKKIFLAIGPEGGFSAQEEQTLMNRGFVPAKLSAHVLRGESASISATAITLHAIDFSAP